VVLRDVFCVLVAAVVAVLGLAGVLAGHLVLAAVGLVFASLGSAAVF
jgi:hypothetical protein